MTMVFYHGVRIKKCYNSPMYKSFYNLKENPFNVTADPSFYYSSTHHAEAFSHLLYGIQERKGIIVITGEIGTGKTTLCRTLLNQLDPTIKTAFILNPYFSELQLLQLIVKDLGLSGPFKNKLAIVEALNAYLLKEAHLGHNVALIIDEAQNLNVTQLEQVRLLSNLETDKFKLLQIILVGQPELMDKLKLPTLRQLFQRVSVRYHILPLEKSEMKKYIYHRLQLACQNHHLKTTVHFTPEALEKIYTFTQGIPRLINILCERALLAGYVAETYSIDEHIIHKSSREVVSIQ